MDPKVTSRDQGHKFVRQPAPVVVPVSDEGLRRMSFSTEQLLADYSWVKWECVCHAQGWELIILFFFYLNTYSLHELERGYREVT